MKTWGIWCKNVCQHNLLNIIHARFILSIPVTTATRFVICHTIVFHKLFLNWESQNKYHQMHIFSRHTKIDFHWCNLWFWWSQFSFLSRTIRSRFAQMNLKNLLFVYSSQSVSLCFHHDRKWFTICLLQLIHLCAVQLVKKKESHVRRFNCFFFVYLVNRIIRIYFAFFHKSWGMFRNIMKFQGTLMTFWH